MTKNWIKANKTVLRLKLPKGYEYTEDIQVHEDNTIKLESYVSLSIGILNLKNFQVKALKNVGSIKFMEKLNKAMKVKRKI